MKTACLTAFFPVMEPFAVDFLDSVRSQIFSDFDLIVINDGSKIKEEEVREALPQRLIWLESRDTPLKNRLVGFRYCQQRNYDLVVCADADESMDRKRMDIVHSFMVNHQQEQVVFNNASAVLDGKVFDLFYKERITWEDLLDFNMLGYGAMNLSRKGVEFLLENLNHRVAAFDWYIGFIACLRYGSVRFLKEGYNHYRNHDDNFVGPVFEVTGEGCERALSVKENFYEEMIDYVKANGPLSCLEALKERQARLSNTRDYIENNSFASYLAHVGQRLKDESKLFWWQEGLLL